MIPCPWLFEAVLHARAGRRVLLFVNRTTWIVLAVCGALLLISAQRERLAPPPQTTTYEYRALVPQEAGPGRFIQVEWYQVQAMGEQGWEMVGVVPFVLHNDERIYKEQGTTRVVTQNYLAYYFKRPRQPQR
jgi:hypothetical protein